MATSYRNEPDLPFVTTRRDVQDAICQSPTHCTLALAGERAVGYPIRVAMEPDASVTIAWLEERGEGLEPRRHSGKLVPATEAMMLLILTDTNKQWLLSHRMMRGSGEVNLTITEHRSKIIGKPRVYTEAERIRAEELREARKRGEEPPAKRRSSPKVRRNRGVRVKAIPAT